MTIPEIVKTILKQEGVTHKQLADKLGVSRQFVSHVMKQEDMRINTVVRILHAVGYEFIIEKRRNSR